MICQGKQLEDEKTIINFDPDCYFQDPFDARVKISQEIQTFKDFVYRRAEKNDDPELLEGNQRSVFSQYRRLNYMVQGYYSLRSVEKVSRGLLEKGKHKLWTMDYSYREEEIVNIPKETTFHERATAPASISKVRDWKIIVKGFRKMMNLKDHASLEFSNEFPIFKFELTILDLKFEFNSLIRKGLDRLRQVADYEWKDNYYAMDDVNTILTATKKPEVIKIQLPCLEEEKK